MSNINKYFESAPEREVATEVKEQPCIITTLTVLISLAYGHINRCGLLCFIYHTYITKGSLCLTSVVKSQQWRLMLKNAVHFTGAASFLCICRVSKSGVQGRLYSELQLKCKDPAVTK